MASATLFPLITLRSRMQQKSYKREDLKGAMRKEKYSLNKEVFYDGFRTSIKKIYRHEGMRGFYKGLLPNLIRVFPQSGIFFFVYETVLRYLQRF